MMINGRFRAFSRVFLNGYLNTEKYQNNDTSNRRIFMT